MNEIVQRLIERTGLPEEQATMAAETVLGFLKERLPEPVASQLEAAIGGEGDGAEGAGILGGLGSKLGGMFGQRGNSP